MSNQLLMRGGQKKEIEVSTDAFFGAVQRLTQTSRACDATMSDGDLKHRPRRCHAFLFYKLSLKQLTYS